MIVGCLLNDFIGLSLNDRTILCLVILLDKTVSGDKTVFALGRSPLTTMFRFELVLATRKYNPAFLPDEKY